MCVFVLIYIYMLIKDLIEELKKLPPNEEVVVDVEKWRNGRIEGSIQEKNLILLKHKEYWRIFAKRT